MITPTITPDKLFNFGDYIFRAAPTRLSYSLDVPSQQEVDTAGFNCH